MASLCMTRSFLEESNGKIFIASKPVISVIPDGVADVKEHLYLVYNPNENVDGVSVELEV